MKYFWETVDTIAPDLGFTPLGAYHLAVLALFAAQAFFLCRVYGGWSAAQRRRFCLAVGALLLADELFKYVGLTIGGNFEPDYLPLHLCSINIFLINLHAWKPSKLLGSFLYFICIPAACAALCFPTWTELPPWNFMVIHSFSIHFLLVLYPLVLTVNRDIDPKPRDIPRCVALLAAMAVPIWLFNRAFDTNFMFLMYADVGNPLALFERFGSHLIGYPVLAAPVIAVMALLLRAMRGKR